MRLDRSIINTSLALLMLAVQPLSLSAQETAPAAPTPSGPIASGPTASETDTGTTQTGAAQQTGEDWPCEQRLQPELSIGAVWSGPDPTAATDSWRQDSAVAALVTQVAPRRLPQDQAVAAIHRFAAGYEKDKADVMTKVFAGLFETLNQERAQIIRGIRHFHDRQQKLADRIQVGTKALDDLDPNSTDPKVADQRAALQQAVEWDSRIFDDRERLLPIVCSVPVTIEQRLFALSRAIGTEITPQQ
ncbi:MAG TPA: hypothetical protein VM659_13635 [Dongiaceae bacterium]|nr:hypothetical protein [Dongiaceae bacterium]